MAVQSQGLLYDKEDQRDREKGAEDEGIEETIKKQRIVVGCETWGKGCVKVKKLERKEGEEKRKEEERREREREQIVITTRICMK